MKCDGNDLLNIEDDLRRCREEPLYKVTTLTGTTFYCKKHKEEFEDSTKRLLEIIRSVCITGVEKKGK